MKNDFLRKPSIIRTVFVALEWVALIVVAVILFSNDGTSAWGYWGAIAVVLITLSPIIVYVIASSIFNVFNLRAVIRNQYSPEALKKYGKWCKLYFFWGIITGALYGGLLVPLFLLENIFLYQGYQNALVHSKLYDP